MANTTGGTYQERISLDTSLLIEPHWFFQNDNAPLLGGNGVSIAPAGHYLWQNGIWGYHGDAGKEKLGQTLMESAEFPTLLAKRRTNSSNGDASAIQLIHRTSQEMKDGFGAGIRFAIEGPDGVTHDIGAIVSSRDGGDDYGDLAFQLADAGGMTIAALLQRLGRFLLVRSSYFIWMSGVIFSQADVSTLANTVTETTLGNGSGALGAIVLGPNVNLVTGITIRITARGYFTTTGTPTLQLKIRVDGVALLDTGAVTLVGTISNRYWELSADLTVYATGAAGQLMGQGKFEYDNAAHSGVRWGMVMTAPTSIDLTAPHDLDISAKWGTADVNNSITCSNATFEILG